MLCATGVNTNMNNDLFKKDSDFWEVVKVVKDIYLSDGALTTLLDFEACLSEVSIYAYKNWILGELVEGPIVGRYTISCTFMWPAHLMPDPRGAKRLLPFDCNVRWKKTTMKVPRKVKSSDDFRAGGKKPELDSMPIWLVEIEIPKELIAEIRTGSVELEGQQISLEDLDLGYETDLDKAATVDDTNSEIADEQNMQDDLESDPFA